MFFDRAERQDLCNFGFLLHFCILLPFAFYLTLNPAYGIRGTRKNQRGRISLCSWLRFLHFLQYLHCFLMAQKGGLSGKTYLLRCDLLRKETCGYRIAQMFWLFKSGWGSRDLSLRAFFAKQSRFWLYQILWRQKDCMGKSRSGEDLIRGDCKWSWRHIV